MLGRVCHFSWTQKSVTLSSTEAEYVALAAGIKETIFLRCIWSFVFPDRDVGCTLVKEDNVGAIHLGKNPATTPKSKYIDIRHHFTRERVTNGEFKVVYVPSEEQHADFLTKSLHQGAFEVHRNFVMNIRRFFFLFLVVDIAYLVFSSHGICEFTCRITRIAEGYETVHWSTGVDQVFLHRGFSFIFPC